MLTCRKFCFTLLKPPSNHLHLRVQPADVSTNVEEPNFSVWVKNYLTLKRRHPSEFFALGWFILLLLTSSLRICGPQQTHTTIPAASFAQRHHVTTTHRKNGGGTESSFMVVEAGFFILWIFLKRSSLDPFRFYFHQTTIGAKMSRKGSFFC